MGKTGLYDKTQTGFLIAEVAAKILGQIMNALAQGNETIKNKRVSELDGWRLWEKSKPKPNYDDLDDEYDRRKPK